MTSKEQRVINKLRKVCQELSDLDLEFFGWSGTLCVVRKARTLLPDCPLGDDGQEILADYFPIHCDGGDPHQWEDHDTEINYLVG